MVSAETELQVRFTVFHEVQGLVLAYCVAPQSSFASKAGVLFDSLAKLEERLDLVGLPGREIARMSNPTKSYLVSINQLSVLGFKDIQPC
jgi:hypothetical protein